MSSRFEPGDHRRKYQQACALPFRLREGRVDFCLITSNSRGDWIFPKGTIEPGEAARDTALKEAYEEAGLYGRLFAEPLGSYDYLKHEDVQLRVIVYLMEVTSFQEFWPEASVRRRRWWEFHKARGSLQRPYLGVMIDKAYAWLARVRPGELVG